jgi:halimadienyl-diphosphate synthase
MEMATDPYGSFSMSVYETGRLIRYAPSLRGHVRRVRFLLAEQRPDGGWGGENEYGLVPTLSATEALLSVVDTGLPISRDELMSSVHRGLNILAGRLNTGARAPLPDTVAVEIIVPALIEAINDHLALLSMMDRRLLPHPGGNLKLLGALRDAVSRGQALPTKLLHSLEVFGEAARGVRFVEPVHGGVGCSPAATAVWSPDPRHPQLEATQELGGGPVPVAGPLAVFERAWVLSMLADAGLAPPARRDLIASLHAAFGPDGVAGGPGLPPDADDTATALYALARLGSPRSPNCLWPYKQRDGHFACFPDERTPSSSTNAHVLQAFGACEPPDLAWRSRYRRAMARISAWLCEVQEPDGSWRDKWHASPYYATACCVLALADYGGERAADALRRAARWVLDTQRDDGSWGRWAGTFEETAYAVRILSRVRTSAAGTAAIAAGCARLRADGGEPYPALWHDKDLYTPVRIVRATGLAALRLAEPALGSPAGERPW